MNKNFRLLSAKIIIFVLQSKKTINEIILNTVFLINEKNIF